MAHAVMIINNVDFLKCLSKSVHVARSQVDCIFYNQLIELALSLIISHRDYMQCRFYMCYCANLTLDPFLLFGCETYLRSVHFNLSVHFFSLL